MDVNDIKIGDIVDFDIVTNASVQTEYRNVKVLCHLDYETASTYIDAQALHVSLYSSLPPGTPNDPEAYTYWKIRFNNGQTTCIGLPWIDESTLAVSGHSTMVITLDPASPEDVTHVRTALSNIGMRVANIEFV